MPRDVRWELVEPWREQAMRNHGQTLERLAERGGLSPEELYLAAHGLCIRDIGSIDEQAAIDWLIAAEEHLPMPEGYLWDREDRFRNQRR